MLTKIITTAIAVAVLAAPTSAFYEECYFSDNECTTKVECLTMEEVNEEYRGSDDYTSNITSCEIYFDQYNEEMEKQNTADRMNVSAFETCYENDSQCSSMCKYEASVGKLDGTLAACKAACDTKCAGCEEASVGSGDAQDGIVATQDGIVGVMSTLEACKKI